MQTQVSTRGTELTEDLRSRLDSVVEDLAGRSADLTLVKFVLEQREGTMAVGLVLSRGEKHDTVVRHAEAGDWDRAFMDLRRRLERALEEAEDTEAAAGSPDR